MDRNELIFSLALGTLGIVLVIGLWQYFSVRRSQAKRGEPTGPAGGTEAMLHHRDADPSPSPDAQGAGLANTPRASDRA